MKYLKKDAEYIPLVFNNISENLYKFDLGNNTPKYYHEIKEQINIDNLLDSNVLHYRHYKSNRTFLGKGLIINGYSDYYCGIVCYKKSVDLSLADDYRKELVFILDENYLVNIYPQILKRIKTAMNASGLSSRKQILLMDGTEIQQRFFCDPLKPSMDDYGEDTQLRLSSEFLKNLQIEVPEPMPEFN